MSMEPLIELRCQTEHGITPENKHSIVGSTHQYAVITWAISNEQIIKSMGLAWDTGAPVWPYETPQILLLALHFPAYIVAQPVANSLGLIAPDHYWVILPAATLWWWFLGSQLDFGLLRSDQPLAMPPFSIVIAFALLLAWAVINTRMNLSRWPLFISGKWSDRAIAMTTIVAPVLWCGVLVSVIAICAKRAAASGRRSTQE